MDPELAVRLTELVEKIGLLRRDMQHKGDLEKYEARVARIEQKFSALAEAIADSDPALAKSLRTAWQLPARSLAFRNAEHRKKEVVLSKVCNTHTRILESAGSAEQSWTYLEHTDGNVHAAC